MGGVGGAGAKPSKNPSALSLRPVRNAAAMSPSKLWGLTEEQQLQVRWTLRQLPLRPPRC